MFAIDQDISRLAGYAPALPTTFDGARNIDGAAFARLCPPATAAGYARVRRSRRLSNAIVKRRDGAD
jgi:hypothetical protein